VSQSLREQMLAAGFAAERVSVVPNGVPSTAVPAERPPPSGAWTLGTVALMRPRKGIEVLLQALALLRRDGLPVRLRAVGPFETPDYERHIRRLGDTLGVSDMVAWPGFTSDVNAALAEFDLFVLPSLFGEGMPMVVLEAMAAGVPVIGTRVEGVPEVIRDNIDGLLARPGDAGDLAAAIGRVVRGDASWSALRRSALIRQAAHFSDHSMAQGVAQIYRRVLGTQA
jgi:glycosyltransferase involved in cell wall biosynthesis